MVRYVISCHVEPGHRGLPLPPTTTCVVFGQPLCAPLRPKVHMVKLFDRMVVVTTARHHSSEPKIRFTCLVELQAYSTAAGVPDNNALPAGDARDVPRSPKSPPSSSKVKALAAGGSVRRAASCATPTSPSFKARQNSAVRER